jgi:hypothetical protein
MLLRERERERERVRWASVKATLAGNIHGPGDRKGARRPFLTAPLLS